MSDRATDCGSMVPPWTEKDCDRCGIRWHFTRSEPKPAPDEYVCPECAAYERGYDDGVRNTECRSVAKGLDELALALRDASPTDDGPVVERGEAARLAQALDDAWVGESWDGVDAVQTELYRIANAPATESQSMVQARPYYRLAGHLDDAIREGRRDDARAITASIARLLGVEIAPDTESKSVDRTPCAGIDLALRDLATLHEDLLCDGDREKADRLEIAADMLVRAMECGSVVGEDGEADGE